MKKRSIAALVAAVFVIALGLFLSYFLIFSDPTGAQYSITLPGQGSALIESNPELGEGNRQQIQTIQVDRTNIQAVISSLRRPETYFSQTVTTYFYRTEQSSVTSKLWKSGDVLRIEQVGLDDRPSQMVLMTDSWVYLWSSDLQVVRYPRQEQDEALYLRSPSYEDLIRMSSDSILEGRLTEQDGQLCLYAKTRDTLTGEVEQWYILLENGLLVYADGMLDGKLTYRTQVSDIRMEYDAQGLFRLPDGTSPS